jgi:hypothetical protein
MANAKKTENLFTTDHEVGSDYAAELVVGGDKITYPYISIRRKDTYLVFDLGNSSRASVARQIAKSLMRVAYAIETGKVALREVPPKTAYAKAVYRKWRRKTGGLEA